MPLAPEQKFWDWELGTNRDKKMKKTIEYIYGVPPTKGFEEIFGAWLVYDADRTFLIDTGVAAGANDLLAKLQERQVTKLDYILISHIHLDHAGGLGLILKKYPNTKIVVHDKGIRHLVAPGRLWESTKEVMGVLADMYGEPAPVDAELLIGHTKAQIPGLKIWETPGHAPHHLSFHLAGHYFAGEAGGCPYYHAGDLKTRPATPPTFFPTVTLNSIDLLLQEPDGPAFFGHTKAVFPLHETLRQYKEQLNFWLDFVKAHKPQKGESQKIYLERLLDGLFVHDHNLCPFNAYTGADLWRERFFMSNSAWGFVSHLYGDFDFQA